MSLQSGSHVYKCISCNESGGPFYSKAADNTSYLSFADKTEVVFYNWLVFFFSTILSEHVYIASFPSTYYVRYTWRQSVSFHKCYTFLYNSCVSFSLYFQCTFLTTCKNSASQMCVHANGKNGLEIELRYIWHVRSLFLCLCNSYSISDKVSDLNVCTDWSRYCICCQNYSEIVCISPFIIWHSKVHGACQKQAMSKKCKTDFNVYTEILHKTNQW